MINSGDKKIKRLYLGLKEVMAAYLGTVKVYPNILNVEKGTNYSEWKYSDPTRNRTATPWERDVLSNGNYSEYRYGTPTTQTETATTVYGDWTYNNPTRSRTVTYKYNDGVQRPGTSQIETATEGYAYGNWTYGANNATRSRSRTKTYTYSDVVKNGTTDTVSENGTAQYGTWEYNDPTRTRTITYKYSDATKDGGIQSEKATEGYKYGAWTYGTNNATRSRSRTKTYTYSDIERDGATDTVSENGTAQYSTWEYSDPKRTRTVSYKYSDITKDGGTQTETATEGYTYGTWTYNSDNSNRSRSRTKTYKYTDITRNGASDTVTENGAVSYGLWTYNDPTRTRSITYTYSSDNTTKSGGTQSETASVTTATDGYWNGSCGTDYYYEDYIKQRSVYTYTDETRYGAWVNGEKRSKRIDGSCGWEKSWQIESDWKQNGKYCNSVGTTGAYDCDGTYSVDYYQEEKKEIYAYPDGTSGDPMIPVEERTTYRAGNRHSRIQVDGQCGFSSTETIQIYLHVEPNGVETQVRAMTPKLVDFSITVYVLFNNKTEDEHTFIIPAGEWYSDWFYVPPVGSCQIMLVTPEKRDNYLITFDRSEYAL